MADGGYGSEVRERALAKVLQMGTSFRGPYATYCWRNKATKLMGSHGHNRESIDNGGEEETGINEKEDASEPGSFWKGLVKQQEKILSEQRILIKQANDTFNLFKNAVTVLEDRVGSLREELERDIDNVGRKIDNAEETVNENLRGIVRDIKELQKVCHFRIIGQRRS